MSELADREQRQQALDPLQSFCVTAPAGSGKTALLIQRYLTVLARVAEPEQVLAITFTRKAAAEMRTRIIRALQQAAEGDPPGDEHNARTRQLAEQVLARAGQQNWRLLESPNRLNIRTIDSWCAYLTRQMPILSSFGGPATPLDDAEIYYQQAVRALLELLEGHWISPDLSRVLLHFDNNWQQLEELLMRMLARREQLLTHLGSQRGEEEVVQRLQGSARAVLHDNLLLLRRSLDPYRSALLECLNYSLGNQQQDPLPAWPGIGSAHLDAWQMLRKLLLSKAGTWRKTVTVGQGFPPGQGTQREAAQAMKARMLGLLGELENVPGLREQLQLLEYLPLVQENSQASELFMSLARLLPLAAAQLTLVFQQHGVVDHAQTAMAAREALGDDAEPTDLAGKLDYSLHHILMDEFQDTSVVQYELLCRLVRGWATDNEQNPDNPKTLFIVGDGMQSIYGFRDADVSLFMQIREKGIEGLPLATVNLQTNFRSDAGLVNWVGGVFQEAFPEHDDRNLAAVKFTPSSPHHPARQTRPLSMAAMAGEAGPARLDEARHVVEIIKQGLRDEQCASIAVLVRTRRHLQPIVQELKRQEIPWQAQDIDSLSDSPAIMDLVSLCRALHNPVDDVAWLALLRAPWAGLSLADLLGLLRERGEVTVWARLNDAAALERLSQEGQQAVRRLTGVLNEAFARRERLPLRLWIEHTWLRLGGPAAAGSEQQQQDAAEFFDLLEQWDVRGQAFSSALLEHEVSHLFSKAESPDCKLQLMSLHRAKGLEFDWVIIPALERRTAVDRRELLLWNNFVSEQGQTGSLFAADDRGRGGEHSVYNWLWQQQKLRREQEVTRLLYVGCTRAVKRLFLTARVAVDEDSQSWKAPSGQSLLSRLWAEFSTAAASINSAGSGPAAVISARPGLRRMVLPSLEIQQRDVPPHGAVELEPGHPPPPLDDVTAREVGNLVHLSLERLSSMSKARQAAFAASEWRDWWRRYLQGRLPESAALGQALAKVEQSVLGVLADQRGRWLLSPLREQARSEYRLSRIGSDQRLREYVIDRSFKDGGVRWIVDYKSATPRPDETVQGFAARQQELYRSQLLAYRETFQAMGEERVALALYFTALPLWHECDYP